MLLITGPGGNVGTQLVDLGPSTLGSRPWRVASRHPVHLTRTGHQPDTVVFDFVDPATWSAALDGVDAMFLLFPLPTNRRARTAILPFIRAAERAGCRHVVYVSVFGAHRARFIPHHLVERGLHESGMTWTVLRCSFFMQNLHRLISTQGIDIVDRGELFVPAGNGRTTFLDARDVAEVAAAALCAPADHRNVTYHLTGPAALTMDQAAAALAVALDRPVRYTRPGLMHFAARLAARGVSWDSIAFMSAVYTLTRVGVNQPLTDDVQRLLDRPPRTLAEFLEDSAWRWRERAWT
jgi:uncharacterized protein YbjT (DUF2867 family)